MGSHFSNKKKELYHYARDGDIESVRMLMEQGADMNQVDTYGSCALYWAASSGHLDVVQYLVEQGASLDKTDMYDQTPLSTATLFGRIDVVRYLLEQGADRDKADRWGTTPLHTAAHKGHKKIAMLLMSYGADLNAIDNHGLSPTDVSYHTDIGQAIRDERRRRIDEAPGKRAVEQDQSSRQPEVAEEPVLEQKVRVEDGVVADEDQDSEPSSDEEEDV